MAYQPIATEIGAVYTLIAPDGSTAVFNDPASGDYVGMLNDVTGLDSADVRESAQDLVEADGGAHGAFYLGRRPITLSGVVGGHASVTARNLRLDRARRASMALRSDAVLKWTVQGAQEVFATVRRQSPFRESGGWIKSFQIALVSENSPLFSTALVTVAGGVASENNGNYPAYPIFEITGVAVNPTVTSSGGPVFRTTGLTLAAGEKVEFDMLNHTGVFTNNVGGRNGQSANRYIDFTNTGWPYFAGLGTTQTMTIGGGGTLSVRYRHAWA